MNVIKINIFDSSIYATKIEINLDTNKIIFNDKEKIYDNKKILQIFSRIIETTKNWKKSYDNPYMIDGISFELEINMNNKVNIYKGHNETPDNFYEIKNIISYLKEDMRCF